MVTTRPERDTECGSVSLAWEDALSDVCERDAVGVSRSLLESTLDNAGGRIGLGL